MNRGLEKAAEGSVESASYRTATVRERSLITKGVPAVARNILARRSDLKDNEYGEPHGPKNLDGDADRLVRMPDRGD